ncbi:MAG: cytochrome c oxidase subunit II [Acidobacteriia bacterium]|nr:cytochrome c oxidase subunit II [Terriglobia bacterium]
MPFDPHAAGIVERVDTIFLAILALCVLFLVGITATMVYFVIRYARKRNPVGEDIEGHAWLEVTWTVIPLALFMGMFYFGWTNFEYMRNPPRDAMVVLGTGRQWAWSFKYPSGRITDELYVALGEPVRVEVRSLDVIHGFYIPAFRVKVDAVPGKNNFLWFTPEAPGTFDIQCTVICGVNHSFMLSKVHVLSVPEFKKWYFADENAPPPGKEPAAAKEAAGGAPGLASARAVLDSNLCLSCHSVDGTPMVGPTFKGLYGAKRLVVARGRTTEVVADDAYLRRAILDPAAEIVKGYPAAMDPAALTDREIEDVIAYLKTLR